MPEARQQNVEVELFELRVLEGPNRFFSRPAIKLEFVAPEAGLAAAAARKAADEVRRLHLARGLPAPELTFRDSLDGLRAVVAYPWRRRTVAQAIGAAAARLALGRRPSRARAREIEQLLATAPGPMPRLPAAPCPIVAVTGTNGKSTTVRLIAHVAATAGMAVGMTNSDGIHLRGELVEAGDWTGFGGATRVLAEPNLDLAVLETARGGILLRGIGFAHDDVAVVTNVSADHLGLQGIDTVEELAEVKSTIVRIARRGGWVVLNGEDALVWEMRRQTRAHRYVFSLDPTIAAVAPTLRGGGRAAVVCDGWLQLRDAADAHSLVAVADLPLAFGGLARHNVANALAAAAACDALGIPHATIAAGLRSFASDPTGNPGRLNLFERDEVRAIVDFAHNEAGLRSLLEVARSIAAERVLLALGTAGDRSDAVIRSLGQIAASAADEIVIAEKHHYLRGRDAEEMNELFRSGARAAGYRGAIEARSSEVEALRELIDRAAPGDVVVLMTHAERGEVFSWLEGRGFTPAVVRP